MSALRNRRNWARAASAIAVSVGVIAAAGVAAPPAQADTMGDAFLSALNNAGVGYNDPSNAVQLGQSICPLLSQPGGSFARAASSIANNGVSPDMADLFTSIASLIRQRGLDEQQRLAQRGQPARPAVRDPGAA